MSILDTYLGKYRKIIEYPLFGILIISSFIFSFYFSFHSWDKQISFSIVPKTTTRGLATNQGERHLVTFPYSSVFDSQNIFKQAKIKNSSSTSIEFLLGNLVIKDDLGNKNFACDFFNSITILFEALDMYIEGEKVTMMLKAPCRSSSDNKHIGPFSIPHQTILNSRISQQKFEAGRGIIEFFNTAISWPTSWILKSIQLQNTSTKKITEQIIDKKNKNFSIFFKNN